LNPIKKSLKALYQLGLKKIWFYTLYQVGLQTGHYRRMTPSYPECYNGEPALAPFSGFPSHSQKQLEQALRLAGEVRKGLYRPFGGEPKALDLQAGASDHHWSDLETTPPAQDIKWIWEPARFGWALTLARAYAFNGDPAFARDFWEKTSEFLDAHTPNLGRQWQSAQEVAIRLMVLVFCDRVFAPSLSASQRRQLWGAIAEHARRIPPTLVYARAQNNNHLLAEAAGLYTAGLYLADHPDADQWRQLGLRWLNWGFQNQIDEFGAYAQHSANYHRLMLQVALFADHFRRLSGAPDWPTTTLARLAAATRWLWALTDPNTGRVPNLGANDGAYLFPLTSQPFEDFRPVVDAAAKAFLQEDIYQQPSLSEMAHWADLQAKPPAQLRQPHAPDMLRLESGAGRAFIHTAQYKDRPSHADQLHVDLWHCGVNIALDPGTYQYNAPPPWDNALSAGFVHNTLTLDGQDQMTRASRFLWLDWAQAQILTHEVDSQGRILRVTAEHSGFRRLGAQHQRTLLSQPDGWRVMDSVIPYRKPNKRHHEARLAWLLPDWDWVFPDHAQLLLTGPHFSVRLRLEGADSIHLVRAGECVHGIVSPEPTWGWRSPTYGEKRPALMLVAEKAGRLPVEIHSTWEIIGNN
jgi:hypothetical protein